MLLPPYLKILYPFNYRSTKQKGSLNIVSMLLNILNITTPLKDNFMFKKWPLVE
jgi:hypothetical protein